MADSKKKAIIWCTSPSHNGTLYNKVKTPKMNCKNTNISKVLIPLFCKVVSMYFLLLMYRAMINPTTK